MVKLILFECRKHFFKKTILLVLILFSIINIVKISSVYHENSLLSNRFGVDWKKLYWEQYESYEGIISQEKIQKLMAIYSPLEQQTTDRTASTAMDNPDTFTGNIYSDCFFFRDCFVRPMEYAYLYQNNAGKIVADAQYNMDFYLAHENIYDYRKNANIANLYAGRQINDFAYTEMYQYYLHYDFSTLLAMLICLYALIGVFVLEKETDMNAILLTTKLGGRKTTYAKIIASTLFVIAVCMAFFLLDFLAFSYIFGSLEGATSPIFTLQNFEYASINMSLLSYACLSAAVKTIGMLTFGMGFLAISSLLKNTILPFIISIALSTMSLVACKTLMGSGHVLNKVLNPFILFVNHELFRKTEFLDFFGFPVLSFVPALLFALLWSGILIVAILHWNKKNANFGKGGDFHANKSART